MFQKETKKLFGLRKTEIQQQQQQKPHVGVKLGTSPPPPSWWLIQTLREQPGLQQQGLTNIVQKGPLPLNVNVSRGLVGVQSGRKHLSDFPSVTFQNGADTNVGERSG